ncbi:unnamed protein product [Linum tenue]|uniref:Uncharacterized protein n=1 Tax=Linum tenue TaxID=586396 RepID=A0AAV0MM08_9ROSI|nr:unnamed protein product [Linum tenue]
MKERSYGWSSNMNYFHLIFATVVGGLAILSWLARTQKSLWRGGTVTGLERVHTPLASPITIARRIHSPGTAESKTGDNFGSEEGGRALDRLLDGRLSGGRGSQRREREANTGGNGARGTTPARATALLSADMGDNPGKPPGFPSPSASEREERLSKLHQTGSFSPYIPRTLLPEMEKTAEGMNQRGGFVVGQGSGQVGMGQVGGAQAMLHFNSYGQPTFFPSPNYLQMAQENMLFGQTQQPCAFWENNQMEAQFLSPWGLRKDEPRKKLKINNKRKASIIIHEQQRELTEEFENEESAGVNGSGRVEVAHQKPPNQP